MLTFRKKILLGDLVLFLVFLALLFPFVELTIRNIVHNSLEQRAGELIKKLQKEPSAAGMAEMLASDSQFAFYRISLFDQEGSLIFDPRPDRESIADASEVLDAVKYGQGYANRYSSTYRQMIVYGAYAFDYQDNEYILRIGLPFTEIRDLAHDFEIGFLVIGMALLALYGCMTWAIIHRYSAPIQEIIAAVEPYQEGKDEPLPTIEIGKAIQEGDEFSKLAHTLNSLNSRIQKQIEYLVHQKNETEAILEALGEGVVAVNRQGAVIFANQTACRMLRAERIDIVGKLFSEIRSGRANLFRRSVEMIEQVAEQQKPISATMIVEDKQRLHYHLTVSPLPQMGACILVLQDKTSDYRVVEMGKEFVANASHELRTPITVIRGFAETLLDIPDLSPEQLREILEKILRTSIRIDSLVKSLLTLADLENMNEERFIKTDIAALCEQTLRTFASVHPDAKVQFHREGEKLFAVVEGDLLGMAVMNLLQNAAKYSPPQSQIDLSVARSGDRVEISVADRGIGIPEQDIPHLFDRFYTVDKARSRKFGGTGLGLSIVKTIVEKHRGAVQVSSQLGQGSRFTISLPCYRA